MSKDTNGSERLGQYSKTNSSTQYRASFSIASAMRSVSGMNIASWRGLNGMAGDLRPRDAHDRRVQVLEGALGNDRRDLAADADGLCVFVDDQHLAGLPGGFQDGLGVQRPEAS